MTKNSHCFEYDEAMPMVAFRKLAPDLQVS